MSDFERLAEIEARAERWEVKGTVEAEIDGEPWGVEGVVGIAVTIREADYNWLLARVRELVAQEERDARVREAVYKLGEAEAHLNDGHYSLSGATEEVDLAAKTVSDIAEQMYYAVLAAREVTE